MQIGKLQFQTVINNSELIARPTQDLIERLGLKGISISEIDETLSDTTAFCEHYDIGPDISANCVIVEAKRSEKVLYAACVILATTKADVNGIIRKYLDARKLSFAPMDTATRLTGMMHGGITPIGLPNNWPILIDKKVDFTDKVIIGSGLRKSKMLLSGHLLASLPNAVVFDIVKT